MRRISYKEYQKIYNKLNRPECVTKFIPKGVLFMRCNNKLIETLEELENYNEREKAGDKFLFTLEFRPFKDIKIFDTPKGYLID